MKLDKHVKHDPSFSYRLTIKNSQVHNNRFIHTRWIIVISKTSIIRRLMMSFLEEFKRKSDEN